MDYIEWFQQLYWLMSDCELHITTIEPYPSAVETAGMMIDDKGFVMCVFTFQGLCKAYTAQDGAEGRNQDWFQ